MVYYSIIHGAISGGIKWRPESSAHPLTKEETVMGDKSEAVVTERPVPTANGGPAVDSRASVLSGRHSSKTRSGRTVGTGMVFQNVCVDADTKRILWDVSGRAVPGQMLAIMGPSGEPVHTI